MPGVAAFLGPDLGNRIKKAKALQTNSIQSALESPSMISFLGDTPEQKAQLIAAATTKELWTGKSWALTEYSTISKEFCPENMDATAPAPTYQQGAPPKQTHSGPNPHPDEGAKRLLRSAVFMLKNVTRSAPNQVAHSAHQGSGEEVRRV